MNSLAALLAGAQVDQPDDGGWAQRLHDNFDANRFYTKPGPYATFLGPQQETSFRQWLGQNAVPFDPNAPQADYDMRGFYQGMQTGDPRAASAIDPNDNRLHYPDTWKTPYHETFSAQSQYAKPVAPDWQGDQLISPGGRILFDDAAPRKSPWDFR